MNDRKKRTSAKSNGGDVEYVLGEAPGHLLRRCQQRAVEIFMEEIGATKLTPRQFALLLTLAQRPGLTQTELVEETGIDRSTVGDMIDRLVRRGLVRRRRSGSDQRANTLAILPDGTAALREALPAVERAQTRIMAPLPAAMRGPFMAALQLMADDASAPESEERQSRRRG